MRSYTGIQFLKEFEYSDIGLCVVDPGNDQIDYCNPAFEHILNKSGRDLIGKNYVDLLGPQWEISQTLFTEMLFNSSVLKRNVTAPSSTMESHEQILEVGYIAVHSDHEQSRWLIISVVQKANSDPHREGIKSGTGANAVLELAKSNILLSELNTILKESQENLESAFEAGNLGQCGINFSTGEVTLSKKGRNFFGLAQDIQVTWELLLEAVNEEFHEMVNSAFSDALTLGKPVDSTYSITHLSSKETRWLRVMAKVHFNAQGEPLKLFGLVMDITEQKNDEQRKNDFIAMVSHELKTPITSAQGYTQLIQRKAEESGNVFLGSLADKAFTQLGRMSKLINGFLNLSRLESGKIGIHRERFDFKALINEVVEDARATIPTHTVQVDKCTNIDVCADRDKIQQVLNNLISNAVKYSTVGTNILISCERMGSFLKTQVRDQGIGIDSETISLVFDRFYRVESTPTEHISGFGIGLYICKEIIDRHQGKIWAESTLGIGTVFSFTLPIA
ncbi:ATP-binding protein [Sphingobacterium bambusae]|uniref:histidine kinase n=1 Tax=Sphingobacterium bambusae TaxID=662858 RepID=A0ABW6BAS8_9SPHI|nr:ATP-binding protein [Sphingobacterium bambusae]WPL48801.1 ATP-binding protein [Sphingobacterium bambusae]